MKKKIKYLIIPLVVLTGIVVAIYLWLSSFNTNNKTVDYVASENNGILTYNNEAYIYIGDDYHVEKNLGIKISLGKCLGEVKPTNFDGIDYRITNNPIQAIEGDENLNFIAKPEWQSPTRVYCKKDYYEKYIKNNSLNSSS